MNFFQQIIEFFRRVFTRSRPPTPVIPPDEIWSITRDFNHLPVTVSASRRFGGAIYSLKWNGFEYIDSTDHGRELQSAYQLDGLGEGENPTEAGSAQDMAGATSTTLVKNGAVIGNVLETTAELAYWYPYRGQPISADILTKKVALGYQGLPNVLHHEMSLVLSGDHRDLIVEGLTSYLPQAFSRFYTFNGGLVEMPTPSTLIEADYPVIAATADGSHALGLYSSKGKYWYGRVGPWPKMDCGWFTVPLATAGNYTWEAFTVFGPLDAVASSLTSLSA